MALKLMAACTCCSTERVKLREREMPRCQVREWQGVICPLLLWGWRKLWFSSAVQSAVLGLVLAAAVGVEEAVLLERSVIGLTTLCCGWSRSGFSRKTL
jgi:hypothetical protein